MSIRVINGKVLAALVVFYLTCVSEAAYAGECTLIIDAKTGATLEETGRCDERHTAASTFKVALALMGYDASALIDDHTPLWTWQPGMLAPARDKKPVDPSIWQADSIIWYSREVTRHLGAERFSSYVRAFDYGNMDISGERGKDNGLSHAWITSLAISPREQTAFFRRLLTYQLPVSPAAHIRAMEIVPEFSTKSGWRVHGKTGSGWTRDAHGQIHRNKPEGWFVGWAERRGRTIVFARLGIGNVEGRQGLLEQKKMLAILEKL
ncbi:penicillin-binding transpeptidase domain-containing protein [Agrobacterium sp. BA1120]|uniref:penicillin-binding transpeptidase domain-containing protein n=1 Tax=Agrobacterium sp. BA1120 TaxID=3228927 RepID=UPI00336A23B5